jgi:holdfast attachment protein HfaA
MPVADDCWRIPDAGIMAFKSRHWTFSAAATLTLAVASPAAATDFSNSASYNTPIGMTAGQENQSVDPALRDQNGNLTVVNGQITSAASAKAFAQGGMGGIGSGANLAGTGVAFGGATAIGNSLNVVTVGNNNTVVVNSSQTNTGAITATTSLNGH